jgi:uncharacterized membrane protein YdjX (TVP38/TMEM64 family)
MIGVPSIPLSMGAGALFGPVQGAALVSSSGLVSACTAFLISRHLARDRVAKLLRGNKKWRAVDRTLSNRANAFKVMLLLRLVPVFPFSISNYFYGASSIDIGPYVAATFLGLLPGTAVYVGTGAAGKSVLSIGQNADSAASVAPIALAVAVALGGAAWVAKSLGSAFSVEEQAEDEAEEI